MQVMDSRQRETVLCARTLAALRRSVGAEVTNDLLADLAVALARFEAALGQAGGRPEEALAPAHALVSLSGNFGLMQLAGRARDLHAACRDPGRHREVARLARSASAGCRAVLRRLPAVP